MKRKFGYIINNGKIFDAQLTSYKLHSENINGNIIYSMIPVGYRRLYRYEPLLTKYSEEKVLLLLNNNQNLQNSRKKECSENQNIHISNMGIIYNYPPSYLKPKKFYYYKLCQELRKKLH